MGLSLSYEKVFRFQSKKGAIFSPETALESSFRFWHGNEDAAVIVIVVVVVVVIGYKINSHWDVLFVFFFAGTNRETENQVVRRLAGDSTRRSFSGTVVLRREKEFNGGIE